MDENRFKIVFTKLDEIVAKDADVQAVKSIHDIHYEGEASYEEIEEIDALRRIILEVMEPEPTSFTTT